MKRETFIHYSSTKCKKGKRLTITANLFMKVHQLDQFRPLQEPIRLQDLLNFARSWAKKINLGISLVNDKFTQELWCFIYEVSATKFRTNDRYWITSQTSWSWPPHMNACNRSQTLPSWAQAAWSRVQHATIKREMQLHVVLESHSFQVIYFSDYMKVAFCTARQKNCCNRYISL